MPGRGRGRGARNGQDNVSTVAVSTSPRIRGLADIVDRYERLGHPSSSMAVANNIMNNNGSTTTTRTSVTASSSAASSSTNEDGKLSTFIPPQELSKLLECPVCYEITLPPVIMCTAGHNLCSECRNKCTRCPVCRSGFCEARNRLAESIVDKCSIQCRYRSLGCDHVLGGRMMAVHLDHECEYRPITCRDCKLKIPYDNYISHLLNDERLPRQIATECSTGFDIEDDDFVQSSVGGPGQSWEPTWLHCYGLDFFCHLETLGNYWWIYVIGLASESTLSNYLCDILVWNRDKKQELRFHGPVHSYRKSGEEILDSGQCIVTSQNAIRSILNQGGIDVVVCIFQVSDYQTPKSRNTGQPIFSPLILRGNSSNAVGTGTGESNNSVLNSSVNLQSSAESIPSQANYANVDRSDENLGSFDDSIIEIVEGDVEASERVAIVAPFNNHNAANLNTNVYNSVSDIELLQMISGGTINISRSSAININEVDAGGDAEVTILSPHRNSSTSTSTSRGTTGTGSRRNGPPPTAPAVGEIGSGEDGERRGRNRIPRESARVIAQVRARSLDGARRRRHTQRSHNHPHAQA